MLYYDSNGNPWYRIRSEGTAPVIWSEARDDG